MKSSDAFTGHLARLFDWLSNQRHIKILRVSYNDLVERPEGQIERVSAFLGVHVDAAPHGPVGGPLALQEQERRERSCTSGKGEKANGLTRAGEKGDKSNND